MAKPKKKKAQPLSQRAPGKEQAKQWDYWTPLLVALVTLTAFIPALWNEFVGWDDYELLVTNLNYRGLGWDQLRWMFTTFHTGHYQPLSWMTFALDYLLWGMNPFGYHLTNLALHAANSALFYFLALRLLSLALSMPTAPADYSLKAAAGFAALLFAIHPLRVESVAWATERRDVLSGLFFLATLIGYLRAVAVPKDTFYRRWLCASLILYVLSLLSKASGATLPIVLLVLDVYPLRRLGWAAGKWVGPLARPVWLEKIPFLSLAIAASIIAPLAQRDAGAVASLRAHGLASRFAQSLYGLAFYLWKTILPTDLSPFYEVPPNLNPFAWPVLLSGAAVAFLSVGFFVLRRRWPAGLASWICYVIIVAPVLGFVQSGRQMVADRYSYLSCLAWAMLAGAGLYYVSKRGADLHSRGRRFLATGAAATVVIVLSVFTWKQVGVWHDTDTLWKRVLAITDRSTFRSGTAHHLVARFYSDRGDLHRAIKHLRLSIEIEPTDATTYTDLGAALAQQGKWEEAIQNLQHALSLNPKLSLAHFNLGNAFALQGRLGEAVQHFDEALRIKPDYAEAYNNLGKVFAAQGQFDRAIDLFRRAVQIQPNFADARQSLVMALNETGRRDEALREFQEAQRLIQSRSQAEARR